MSYIYRITSTEHPGFALEATWYLDIQKSAVIVDLKFIWLTLDIFKQTGFYWILKDEMLSPCIYISISSE